MNAVLKDIDVNEIIGYLKSMNGEIMLVTKIAKHFGVGHSAIGKMLSDIAITQAIRQTKIFESKAFYIPTQAQLDAEAKTMSLPQWRVGEHKINRERRELYDRINAERSGIKSIG